MVYTNKDMNNNEYSAKMENMYIPRLQLEKS